MRKLLLLCLTLALVSCSKKMLPNTDLPTYKLIKEITTNLSKSSKRSKVEFQINFDSGEFKGKYNDAPFEGKYLIEHTSAGFSKGFFYRVSIESMVNQAANDTAQENFYEALKSCTRISISPDKLIDPTYTQIEISSKGLDSKLLFVHLN